MPLLTSPSPGAPARQASAFNPGPDAVTTAWDAELGRPGGVLAGVHLGAGRELPHGAVAYPVTGVPVELATLRAARPVIAAVLNRPMHTVVTVQAAGQLELLLLDDALLRQPIAHPGPAALDTTTGVVVLGVHADAAPAVWQLWTTSRAHHGVIIGGTQRDQDEVLHGLAIATTGHEAVTCWQIDLSGDGALTGAARSAADVYEAVALVAEVEALVGERTAQLTAMRRRWQPTPEMPLVLVTVAAAGRVLELTDDTGRSVAEILAGALRRAGHVGVSLVLAVDNPRLDTFGGFCGLRSSVMQPNLLQLPSRSAATAPLPADIADPSALPRQAGLGYLLGNPIPLRLFAATNPAPGVVAAAPTGTAGRPAASGLSHGRSVQAYAGLVLTGIGEILQLILAGLLGAIAYAMATAKPAEMPLPPAGLLIACAVVIAAGLPAGVAGQVLLARSRRQQLAAVPSARTRAARR